MKIYEVWSIMPPDGFDEDFQPQESLGWSAEEAWKAFCYPALRREGYEDEGFSPVLLVMILP